MNKYKKRYSLLPLLIVVSFSACSVFNPNPGENEADIFIQKKKYDQAIELIQPLAEQGMPWAQLRLGIAYEYGQALAQSSTRALLWYKKVAVQNVELPWADGVQILSAGEHGFFNQNNDAKAAQYLIARIYAQDRKDLKKNLPEAWRWANHLSQLSQGKDILLCCENSKLKAKHIKFSRVETLLKDIENKLGADELEKIKSTASTWKPQ